MWIAIALISFLVFVIAIFGLIVTAIMQRPAWKKWLATIGISVVLFVAAAVATPTSVPPPQSTEGTQTQGVLSTPIEQNQINEQDDLTSKEAAPIPAPIPVSSELSQQQTNNSSEDSPTASPVDKENTVAPVPIVSKTEPIPASSSTPAPASTSPSTPTPAEDSTVSPPLLLQHRQIRSYILVPREANITIKVVERLKTQKLQSV